MSAIQISAVRKQFGKQEILKSIDLEIRDKEFTVLLGPSGCGKSTLLRIIAGLEYESSGSIRIGEREMTSLAPRDRRIAMVFQNYAVFPHMTVAENIAFGLRVRKDSEAHIQRKVKETAELMHIEDRLDHYSGQLSGGQRQRVAVARALAMEPEVLLMDEPLSNLDALLRLEMRAELKTILAASDTTTIYVTHDQVEAWVADRIAVMKGGQIEQYAPPSEITTIRRPNSSAVSSAIHRWTDRPGCALAPGRPGRQPDPQVRYPPRGLRGAFRADRGLRAGPCAGHGAAGLPQAADCPLRGRDAARQRTE